MRTSTAALVLAFTFVLAACTPDSGPPPSQTQPGSDTEHVSESLAEPLPDALPLGFALNFPYHFAEREIANAGHKNARLRYTVEYLAGDVNAIVSSLEESAKAAGFDSTHVKRFDDGRTYFIAKKEGYGDLRSVIEPAGDRKLRNAAAKGTVVMGWPVQTTVDAADPP